MLPAVRYLTDFADQAVILPVVFAVGAALALQGWWRGAVTWLVAIASTFVVTLFFKLIFLSCSPVFGPLDVQSPSGHVAAATVVSGGLAVMLGRRRISILPTALIAALVIGVSRLLLGAHSLPEVIVGAMIGFGGAVALMRFAGAPPRLAPIPIISAVLVTALIFHGIHLPAEAAIRHTAFRVARFIPQCRGAPEMYWAAHNDDEAEQAR